MINILGKLNLDEINQELRGKGPKEIIDFAFKTFGRDRLTVASSLSIEDQMLTHLALEKEEDPRVFVLDTGRHFQSTYDTMNRTQKLYKFNYEVYFPDTKEIEEMVRNYGPNAFYLSVEDRKRCCKVRKINPLKRALGDVDAWIVGLRKEQSVTRDEVEVIEFDENFGIYKISPLVNLSEEDVWEYINENKVPYNELHKKGFRSIGCEPCTRAVKEGEDIRAGRWWWENPESKECGLHLKGASKI